MATHQIYVDTPLEKLYRPIRLLQIPKEEASGSFRYTLASFPLTKSPSYHALSYAWMDPTETRGITVASSTVDISLNLFNFLSQNTLLKAGDWIWIDALCIDQGNIPERNDQVKRMRDIYSNASSVIVWLGPRDEELGADEDTAIDLINLTASEGRLPSWEEASSIAPIFRRPYWGRIWVVQELLLARALTIICGARILGLYSWACQLLDMTLEDSKQIDPDGYMDGCLMNTPAFKLLALRHRWCRLPLEDQALSLRELMNALYEQKCTDPRDMIYGVLGLLPLSSARQISIDYSRTTNDIFVEVVKHIFANGNTHNEGKIHHLGDDVYTGYSFGLPYDEGDLAFIWRLRYALDLFLEPVNPSIWQYIGFDNIPREEWEGYYHSYESNRLDDWWHHGTVYSF